MYKIKLYGAKGYTCQIPRIAQGLVGIGNRIVGDFVYSNNFDYEEIDEEHGDSAISNSGFKIFNVLDIPEHLPDYPVEKLREQLKEADIVTCISPPVQEQLKRILNLDVPCIWNPIKDVFFDPVVGRDIDLLFVGRGTDPNKRLLMLENLFPEITAVGPVCPAVIGKYLGQVADTQLQSIYNRTKVLALPTRFEGLGLTPLEAMVCGAVPLVCSDNPNSNLCPEFCVCFPSMEEAEKKYRDLLENYETYRQIILRDYTNQIAKKFSKFSIAENIIDLYNSKN